MVMTDPIADYLTRTRDANMAERDSAEIPASTIKKSLSEALKREGFIRGYGVADDNRQGVIKIFLKCGPNGEHVISGLKRISKPGLRDCVGAENLPKILNGLGTVIIPTSAGVIIDKETRERNIGGETLAYIW